MFAAITFLASAKLVGLIVLALLLVAAFVHWIGHGGFIGWWLANDVVKLLGVVLTAIAEIVGGMLRD